MGGTLLQHFIPHGATRDPFPLVYSHDPASIHSYELGYVQVETGSIPRGPRQIPGTCASPPVAGSANQQELRPCSSVHDNVEFVV